MCAWLGWGESEVGRWAGGTRGTTLSWNSWRGLECNRLVESIGVSEKSIKVRLGEPGGSQQFGNRATHLSQFLSYSRCAQSWRRRQDPQRASDRFYLEKVRNGVFVIK